MVKRYRNARLHPSSLPRLLPRPTKSPLTTYRPVKDRSLPFRLPPELPAASPLATTPVTSNVVEVETSAPSPPPPEATLPRDLTPLGMFMSADNIVKAVMLGLLFASVLTWTIWLVKTFELVSARRSLDRAQELLAGARSCGAVVRPASDASPHVAQLIQAVEGELRRSTIFTTVTASRNASPCASRASGPASGGR